MEKLDGKKIKQLNSPVAAIKKSEVDSYIEKFSKWKHQVGILALQLLAESKSTYYDGQVEDILGKVLMKPPEKGDLSVPTFFENDVEVFDLPKGFLYIFKPVNGAYHISFHFEKPSEINPYLDVRTAWKQAYPAIVRDSSKLITTAGTLSRLTSFAKLI
ncbi:hypothetical protein [Lactobacillus amylolyticus]|uniref:hypothetical protein n=1 Tax=Lactobacillus amylolyticus TaxID=83683 RepID=UPI00248F5593|nr:hypothetical protein [Lactobacillus amylolyticus]